MKGHVYKRGDTFTYMFDAPPDPLTGKRRQVTKGGFATEREAWRECREAIKRVDEGRHVAPSRRTVGAFLVDEWLPAIKDSTAATTWGNWKVYAESYVVPVVGAVRLQELTAPRVQALYAHLLSSGRVKANLERVRGLARRDTRTRSCPPAAQPAHPNKPSTAPPGLYLNDQAAWLPPTN